MCGLWSLYSISLMINSSTCRDFLKCSDQKHYPVFVCVSGHTVHTQPGCSHLCFSIYLLLPQSLQISERWEIFRFFLSMCTALVWSSGFVGMYQSCSNPLLPKASHSSAFPSNGCVSLLFNSTVIHYHRQQQLKYLPVNVFDMAPL